MNLKSTAAVTHHAREPSRRAHRSRASDVTASGDVRASGFRAASTLYVLHLWALFGLALSNLFLGLALLAAPASWKRGVRIWARRTDILLPLLAYVCILLASTLLSSDPGRSVRELSELFTLAAIPLGLLVIDSERRARQVVNGLIVVAVAAAVYGLGELLGGSGDIANRIRGPFSIYMTFAGFLMLGDLLLLSQMVYSRGWRSVWRWLGLAVINLALLGSLTRSAWVALVLTLALLLLARAPRYLLILAAAVALVALLAPAPVAERMRSIVDLEHPTNYDRLCMLEAGLQMAADRPLFGVGPGLVEDLFPIYRHPTAVSQTTKHLHNSFVHLAAERGLLTLAAYVWLFGAALLAAWRGWRDDARRGGGRGDLYTGALAGLLAFNLAGLFEYNWGDTELQRVALFLVVVPFALRGLGSGADPAPDPEPAHLL